MAKNRATGSETRPSQGLVIGVVRVIEVIKAIRVIKVITAIRVMAIRVIEVIYLGLGSEGLRS